MKRMTIALLLGLSLASAAMAGDKAPFAGTWKLNLGKSQYDPGPPPRSATSVLSEAGEGMRAVEEWVDAQGKSHRVEWTAKFDGKEYSVTGGDVATTISLTRPDPRDPHTVDWVWKEAGKVASSGRTVYSKDGKLRTISATGTDAAGKTTRSTRVFERQ